MTVVGFLKRRLEAEEGVLHDSSLLGMRRLAPRLCEKLAYRCGTWAGALASAVALK